MDYAATFFKYQKSTQKNRRANENLPCLANSAKHISGNDLLQVTLRISGVWAI
jgi:hypothetical protein